jgi:alpha-tubulin suppressor-like RCC1 family protein
MTPIPIAVGQTWNTVRASYGPTCAIRSDSTLWFWGSNGAGQLGNGTTDESHVPVQAGSATDELGNEHTSASSPLWLSLP